jgi:thioredoxin 1
MKAIDVTDENINTILSSQKPLLLDFSAEWCGPCKMMSPVVELIAKEVDGKAIVGKLDIDSNPNTAARFGIRNFPTFLFFKDGKLVDRVIGAVPKSVLDQKVKSLL